VERLEVVNNSIVRVYLRNPITNTANANAPPSFYYVVSDIQVLLFESSESFCLFVYSFSFT
jgi:hypothetical protein